MPAKEFGDILKPLVGAAGAVTLYESLQNATEYPPKFNSNMSEVLEKLPIQMTSLEQWAKEYKGYFLN